MLSDRLITEMGLIKLQAKGLSTVPTPTKSTELKPTTGANNPVKKVPLKPPQQPVEADAQDSIGEINLEKDAFRLLVKMLQAIGHECTYDHINCDGQTVNYQHPKKTLVFSDINLVDTDQVMNLSNLNDLLINPALKRPVWEKLKTLSV